MFQGFSQSAIDFLWGVRFNNERPWFEAHKQEYQQLILEPLKELALQTQQAMLEDDLTCARMVEPLEEVIDELKEKLRSNHVSRLQQGSCSMETGFVWADLLTNLERIGDHCSNIASCVLDMQQHSLNTHALLRSARSEPEYFEAQYKIYTQKYHI